MIWNYHICSVDVDDVDYKTCLNEWTALIARSLFAEGDFIVVAASML